MANAKARTKGTGAAGSKSSRWTKRTAAKKAAAKGRRQEDRVAAIKGALLEDEIEARVEAMAATGDVPKEERRMVALQDIVALSADARGAYSPAERRVWADIQKLAEAELTKAWKVDAKLADIQVEHHGSVALLRPMSPSGQTWLEGHLQIEGWQRLGAAVAVGPRYVPDIVAGMRADGLKVAE